MMVPKFRAYIKDLDEFDYNDVPHKGHFVYGNLIKGKPNDNVDAIVGDLIEINDEYVNVEFWKSIEKGSAEQATGVKDANGKEIYEGDIIQYNDQYYEQCMAGAIGGVTEYIGTVVKRIGAFGILIDRVKHTIASNYYHHNDFVPFWSFDDVRADTELKGNVHENPELLEAQHD